MNRPSSESPTSIVIDETDVHTEYPSGIEHKRLRLCVEPLHDLTKLKMVRCESKMPLHSWLALMKKLESSDQLTQLRIRTIMGGGCFTTGEQEFCDSLSRILRRNKGLRHCLIYFSGIGCTDIQPLVDALADHPALVSARLTTYGLKYEDAAEIARRSRKLTTLIVSPVSGMWSSPWPGMRQIVTDSPSLHTFQCGAMTVQDADDKSWRAVNPRLSACVIALLPMCLSPYELLWVLDWLPPMNRRYNCGDSAHDPHHGKKVALIEGLVRSYRAIKG